MRLIDVDELSELMTAEWFLDSLAANENPREIKKKIKNAIDSVPLAYDVEKVVAEIKEYSFRTFGEIRTENVVEIVRKGGVE